MAIHTKKAGKIRKPTRFSNEIRRLSSVFSQGFPHLWKSVWKSVENRKSVQLSNNSFFRSLISSAKAVSVSIRFCTVLMEDMMVE